MYNMQHTDLGEIMKIEILQCGDCEIYIFKTGGFAVCGQVIAIVRHIFMHVHFFWKTIGTNDLLCNHPIRNKMNIKSIYTCTRLGKLRLNVYKIKRKLTALVLYDNSWSAHCITIHIRVIH